MKEQPVTLDTAKLAKERGFDITTSQIFYRHAEADEFESRNNLCVGDGYRVYKENWSKYFTLKNVIYKPTQSLLQKWLREVHAVDVYVISEDNGTYYFCMHGDNMDPENYILELGEDADYEEKFEDALEKGLVEALKVI